MTIGGFIIMALIVFAAFALWYWVVHRNNAASPQDNKRKANGNGTNRAGKAKTAFGTETGSIGERDRNGYTSSSFEYMGENYAVTDDSSKKNQLLPNGRGQQNQQSMMSDQSLNSPTPVKLAGASASTFRGSEIGVHGSNHQFGPVKSAQDSARAYQKQAQQGAQGQGQQAQQQFVQQGQQQGQQQALQDVQQQIQQQRQVLNASVNQQYQTEVGSMGQAQKGQGQRQAVKPASSSAQVFLAEVGTVGDVQQGNTGAAGKNQDPNQYVPSEGASAAQGQGQGQATNTSQGQQGQGQATNASQGQQGQGQDGFLEDLGDAARAAANAFTSELGGGSAQQQQQQQQQGGQRQQNAANYPRYYHTEIGAIGGTQQGQAQGQQQQGQQRSKAASAKQQHSTEIGEISAQQSRASEQQGKQQGGNAASANQQYSTEIGSMGAGQQAQGQQAQGQQIQGQQPGTNATTARLAAEKYTAEIGQISAQLQKQATAQKQQGGGNAASANQQYSSEIGEISAQQSRSSEQQGQRKQGGNAASANQQYSTEIGSMGGTDKAAGQNVVASVSVSQSPLAWLNAASQATRHQNFEIGSIGATDQVPGRSKHQGSNGVQKEIQLESAHAGGISYGPHNYTAEVGTIGEVDSLQQAPAHRAPRQEQQADHHKYSVEAGEIGEVTQYRTYPDPLGLAQNTPKKRRKNKNHKK